jgi:pyruvate/2-oxoglutarate dehydrogenase complex dihydrolipoamide dehydrogenase (E3) component
VPPIPGLAGTPFWTNREAIEAERVPCSLVILGGGAVGVELGQVFARFGSRVTVVEGAGRLLPLEEPEAGDLLAKVFGREGIGVHTGQLATGVGHNRSGFTVTLGGGELTGEALLVATGRRTDLAGVGVGAVGIDESLRAIPVDGHLRAAPGVWALVTSRRRSPTCPRTRRGSWWPTSSVSPASRRSTTPCPGSPSPIRRWARSG